MQKDRRGPEPDGARRAVSTGSRHAALSGFTQGLGARVNRFLVSNPAIQHMLLSINGAVLNSNFSSSLALSVLFNGRVGRKSSGFAARVEFSILLLKPSSSASFPLQPFTFPGFPPHPTPPQRLHLPQCVAQAVGIPVWASLPGTTGPWWGR